MTELEEKAVGLGTVAGQEDAHVIMNCLQKAGVMRFVEAIENPAPIVIESNNAPYDGFQLQLIHCWGGKCMTFWKISSFQMGVCLRLGDIGVLVTKLKLPTL